jgi:poly-gamma-glutamate synthesis protein (capsule biosynthesis protein)
MKKKRKKKKSNNKLSVMLMAAVIGIVFSVGVICMLSNGRAPAPLTDGDSDTVPQESTTEEPVTEPDPVPYIVSTAKIGSAGDILIHKPILEGANNGDSYSFDKLFTYVKDTAESYDYFVLNLETTLAGNEGRKYTTYPCFNSPDSLLDSLSLMGTDCLLTANNHSYDTGEFGFLRTVETVEAAGFDHTGTYTSPDEKRYIIEEVNGIKFGFICYAYETPYNSDTVKALNGITMNKTLHLS